MRPVHETVFDEALEAMKVHVPTLSPQVMVTLASAIALRVKERIDAVDPAEWASWRKSK